MVQQLYKNLGLEEVNLLCINKWIDFDEKLKHAIARNNFCIYMYCKNWCSYMILSSILTCMVMHNIIIIIKNRETCTYLEPLENVMFDA